MWILQSGAQQFVLLGEKLRQIFEEPYILKREYHLGWVVLTKLRVSRYRCEYGIIFDMCHLNQLMVCLTFDI